MHMQWCYVIESKFDDLSLSKIGTFNLHLMLTGLRFFIADAAVANTESKVNLAIVDIDELGDLAIDHQVQAVPTVVAFKNGEIVDKFVGLIDDDKLDAFITKLYV